MQAGRSRVEITPPEDTPMMGYLARTKGAEGIHDPLLARALVLDDGDQRVALVGADLCAFDVATARGLRHRIAEATSIPAGHIMLALTHTHAGPLVASRRIGEQAAAYIERMQEKLVQVAAEAASSLVPCRIGAGRAKVYLGVNRRERNKDGRIVIGTNPDGYACPYSHVLVIAKEDGGPIGILFTHGAHPVVLGSENLMISGDYAGVAEREVEGNYGGDAVALFALGFAGNVNVQFKKRHFGEVETCGVSLARAVLEAVKDIDYSADVRLGAWSHMVPLPLEPPPSPAEAQRILFEQRQRLSDIFGRGEQEAEIHRRRMMVEWASELVRLANEEGRGHVAELELQCITIGSTALLALSAEVFAEYAKDLDALSPFDHTFPISNANGDIGYIPTAAAFEEGGYEVEDAPRLIGPLPFLPEVEGVVRDAMRRILAEAAGLAPEDLGPAEEEEAEDSAQEAQG